ncbi:hypothetical protein HBI56_207260 [Parastagonospora nodorum]|uniref:Uncharacterized protein n=1 Tax=Phaeosphaeria nodorum (strain SN15 / ATCC MYA-4574 / FGSC 10173) TaxID=321614 RepID=A0A7U2I8Z2_PHANO|nr:hypothetical protein HBH56_217740 [Parastagonospora nodorum]QRD05452.1 hypothetical protein JI435_422480 [Parastagonospora nodorum SN15]KAH3922827.1 hypothetical protein HBH54_219600 [Parastagonospora nodorum]KAH3941123.1 hypothetical protein HBH53_205990 [Parastagonospora nodorum]KAH3958076.1 hypothetical protein HBH51_214280 [Parastagonospora nodorum]
MFWHAPERANSSKLPRLVYCVVRYRTDIAPSSRYLLTVLSSRCTLRLPRCARAATVPAPDRADVYPSSNQYLQSMCALINLVCHGRYDHPMA